MSKLNYISAKQHPKADRPIKILQFGEGNFLRAFVDYYVEVLNSKTDFNSNITIIKPTARGNLDKFKSQDNLYTVLIRGLLNGQPYQETKIVTNIEDAINPYEDYDKYISYAKLDSLEFIISNTTEAGIVNSETDKISMMPPSSYPAKLTQFLYERYCNFQGSHDKGLTILPVELIDNNGDALKLCVNKQILKWQLPSEFSGWVNNCCSFINTLVDKIVTGYPKENVDVIFNDLGYMDELLVTAEPFGLWVIEGNDELKKKLCIDQVNLPIIFTDNHKPFKERKVRILNGAHTSFALLSYLCGNNYVKESLENEVIKKFIETAIYKEIIPTLSLPKCELESFAKDVLERFSNPYVKHSLLSISLNSVSKWRTRCLPSLLEYYKKFGILPDCLVFSLAALIKFYKCESNEYQVIDDKSVLDFFDQNSALKNSELSKSYLQRKDFHGSDLSLIPNLVNKVTTYLDRMDMFGIKNTLIELENINEEIHDN